MERIRGLNLKRLLSKGKDKHGSHPRMRGQLNR